MQGYKAVPARMYTNKSSHYSDHLRNAFAATQVFPYALKSLESLERFQGLSAKSTPAPRVKEELTLLSSCLIPAARVEVVCRHRINQSIHESSSFASRRTHIFSRCRSLRFALVSWTSLERALKASVGGNCISENKLSSSTLKV